MNIQSQNMQLAKNSNSPENISLTEHHNQHHGLSTKVCIKVWLALMILTAITVGVAEVDLGLFHVLVAMLVATIKAGIVILWFMHIKYEGAFIRLMVFIAFFILSIFLSFTFFDVAYR